jgi:hypothetical protein
MRGSPEWRSLVEHELADLIHLLDRKADKSQLTKYLTSPDPRTNVPLNNETEADVTALFSAFNRVARQKLDTTTLAEFAGVPFVDSRYQKRSVLMSAHLTESCTLDYQLFDMKITELEQRCREFQVQCRERLAVLNERMRRLHGMVKRLLAAVRPGARQAIPAQVFSRTMAARSPVEDPILKSVKVDLARTVPLKRAVVDVSPQFSLD